MKEKHKVKQINLHPSDYHQSITNELDMMMLHMFFHLLSNSHRLKACRGNDPRHALHWSFHFFETSLSHHIDQFSLHGSWLWLCDSMQVHACYEWRLLSSSSHPEWRNLEENSKKVIWCLQIPCAGLSERGRSTYMPRNN